MSTIVFAGAPAHGHVNPTLPVVRELIARGERVIYYNTPEFQARIEPTGATFRAYPRSVMDSEAIAAALQDGNLVNVTHMIFDVTETWLPFLLESVPDDAPDLLIFDSTALWGRMAATLLNGRAAASITHFVASVSAMELSVREFLTLLGMTLPKVPGLLWRRRKLIRRFGRHAYTAGRPLFPMRGGLNIVFTARELQPDVPILDETFRFVGPSIQERPRDAEFPFDALGDGKVVYVSLGTVHRAQSDFIRECFAAFAEYPARFVLAAGPQPDREVLERAPANFIVRPFVPQLELLQRVDAFITHGGMNSMHEGLYYGVPLVVIPHQFEQLLNARIVARWNAGVALDGLIRGKSITAADLRSGLEQVLHENRFRAGAGRVREILRATGGYRQAADAIQAYIAGAGRGDGAER